MSYGEKRAPASKKISLTDDEWFDLLTAAEVNIRPTNSTPRLVKLGLLHGGSSRFGEWLRVTEQGYKFLHENFAESCVRDMKRAERSADAWYLRTYGVPYDRNMAPANAKPTPAAAKPAATPTAARPAAANSTKARPAGAKPAAANPAKARPAGAKPAAARPAAAIQPNAVRVTVGKKVTYYPVTYYETLGNVAKQKVFTINTKFFRSFPVEASAADVAVP